MKNMQLNLNSSAKKNEFRGWEVGKDYKLIKILGQGSYGSVAEALHVPSKKTVAIKRMDDR